MPTEHATETVARVPVMTIERSAKALFSGFAGKGLLGLGAISLTIIGLAGVAPHYMMTIGAICVGVALLWEGSSVLSEFNRVVSGATFGSRVRIEAGTLTLCAGGLGGLVLSILALLGFHPLGLVSIAAIAYGAALLVGSYVTYGIELALPWNEKRPTETFPGSRAAASGVEDLAGVGSVVLGIIALGTAAAYALPLNLIAMLAIGCAALFSGAVTGGEFTRML